MLKITKKRLLCYISCFLLVASAHAAEVNITGFASLKGTYVSKDNNLPSQFDHLPGDGAVSFASDSLYALQLSSKITDKFSTTIQLVAEGRSDFDINANWAYLSYQATPSLQWKIGRMPIRIFYRSEYEKVGFTNDFGRLPTSVYRGFDFSTIEGVGASKSFIFDDLLLKVSGSYGSWDGEILTITGRSYDAAFDDLFSLNFELDGDWWKVFAGGFNSTWSNEVTEFDYFILSLGAPAVSAAQDNGAEISDIENFNSTLPYSSKTGWYRYAGYSINKNNFLSDFEYVTYGVDDSLLPDARGWFVTAGYQFGDSVITFRAEKFKRKLESSIGDQFAHPILKGTATALHSAFLSDEIKGNAISYRYDFLPTAAFKAEIWKGEEVNGEEGDFSIITAGVDFIF